MSPTQTDGARTEDERCQHSNMPPVEFDEQAAKGLGSYEVRKRWPRSYSRCPDCKEMVMRYASSLHYYSGDW